MRKIDITSSTSSPTWRTLDTVIREQGQTCLQRVLEEDVDARLGRGRHERRAAEAVGDCNGYGKPRHGALMNGTITVRRPRVRGRDARFASRLLPLCQRRTPEVATLLPELYLHGLSSGDFTLAVRGLLGEGAPLSASRVQRLTEDWPREYGRRRVGPLERRRSGVAAGGSATRLESPAPERRRVPSCGGAVTYQRREALQDSRARGSDDLAAAACGGAALSEAQRAGTVPRCLRWPSLRRWGRSVHRVIHPEGRRLTCVYILLDETSLEPACGDGNFLVQILQRKRTAVELTDPCIT